MPRQIKATGKRRATDAKPARAKRLKNVATPTQSINFCDFPVEILDRILVCLRECPSDDAKKRNQHDNRIHRWAKQACTVSKSWHQWLLPVVWERLIVPFHIEKQRKHPRKNRNCTERPPYLEDTLSQQMLVVDTLTILPRWMAWGEECFPLEILTKCVNLRRLILGDQDQDLDGSGRFHVDGINQVGPSYSQTRLAWPFNPRASFEISDDDGAPPRPIMFPRLTDLLVQCHGSIEAEHYNTMLIDTSTGESICPNLRWLHIMETDLHNDGLTDGFIDNIISFCQRHPKLRRLDIDFGEGSRNIVIRTDSIESQTLSWSRAKVNDLRRLLSETQLDTVYFHYKFLVCIFGCGRDAELHFCPECDSGVHLEVVGENSGWTKTCEIFLSGGIQHTPDPTVDNSQVPPARVLQ